jgi:hypothetical protein
MKVRYRWTWIRIAAVYDELASNEDRQRALIKSPNEKYDSQNDECFRLQYFALCIREPR